MVLPFDGPTTPGRHGKGNDGATPICERAGPALGAHKDAFAAKPVIIPESTPIGNSPSKIPKRVKGVKGAT